MPPDNCIPFPNVEVAVVEKTSSEESLSPALKVWSASHRLALAMLREETTDPVVGEIVKEPSELETEVTPPETQDPKISLKQPPDSWIPFAKVEVAEVEKTSNDESLKPALKEEVAV